MADLQIPIHAGDRARGAEDAPAALVMYGDYECPYTRAAYRVVQKLLAGEPDALRFVFRHFPLTSIHPHAQQAAEAAEAAGAQFERELTDHSHSRRIEGDVKSGLASGVQGTPTLFLNGELLTEGYDEATLRAALASIAADRRGST